MSRTYHAVQRLCSFALGTAGRFKTPFIQLVTICAIAVALTFFSGLPLQAQATSRTTTFPFVSTGYGGTSQFNYAIAVAVDAAGNVYILDRGPDSYPDPRIPFVLKESLAGGVYTETKITISAAPDPSGIAVDASGNLYIADPSNHRVLKETPSASGYTESNLATGSALNTPVGIAVDSNGNIYIADAGNAGAGDGRVLKEIPGAGGYTEVVIANNSSSPYPVLSPCDVAVDKNGAVYVTDCTPSNPQILKETPSEGSYTGSLIADKGMLPNGAGTVPYGIAVDGSGNVFVADPYNQIVFEAVPSPGGYSVSVLPEFQSSICPRLATDASGNLWVVPIPPMVGKVAFSGAASWQSLPVGQSSNPAMVTFVFRSSGTLSNTTPYQVLTMGTPYPGGDTPPEFLDLAQLWGNCGAGGACCTPGMAYSPGSSCIVGVQFQPNFLGTRTGAVSLFDSDGHVLSTAYLWGTGLGPEVSMSPTPQFHMMDTGLVGPAGVATDEFYAIYVADPGNNRVVNEVQDPLSPAWLFVGEIGEGLSHPQGVARDASGNVYIADTGHDRVLKETLLLNGSYAQSTVGSGLSQPQGVAVDPSGNVYIADTGNNRVVKETLLPDGTYAQSEVKIGLGAPAAVAADADGNVFIADTNNNRILKETPSGGGYIQSVVRDDVLGPRGLAVDNNGSLCIADTGHHRILSSAGVLAGASEGLVSPIGVANSGEGGIVVADSGTNRVFGVARGFSVIDFGAVTPGSESAPQTLRITNIGNAPMIEDPDQPWTITGPFVVAGADCTEPFTLAPGEACNIILKFTPSSSANGEIEGEFHLYIPEWRFVILKGTSTNGVGQTITFKALPASVTYGVGPIAMTATASSGLPVTFSVISGPATVNGNKLTITGAGAVVVQADQSGNTTYAPAAPVQQILTVAPAPLTIQVNNATRAYGAADPTFASNIGGLKHGDTVTVDYSTTATVASPVGTYPITAAISGPKAANYTLTVKPGTLTITKAKPVITWLTPAPIIYGTPLSETQLNATASADGTFVYTPAAGTVLAPGSRDLKVTFTPADKTDYSSAAATVKLQVNKATPVITWNTPAAITYGTKLGAAQLNATASVPGKFAYKPPAGTVLGAGTRTLSATFTPTDVAHYNTVTTTVQIAVQPAPLTITAKSFSVKWNAPIPALTYTATGFVNGETKAVLTGAPLETTTATRGSDPGNYPITITQGTLNAANYTFVFVNGTLTLTP